jgi:hypothetical protein
LDSHISAAAQLGHSRIEKSSHVGDEVKRSSVMKAADCSVLHYHGYAVYDSHGFFDRGLQVSGNETLQVRDVFALRLSKAPLVTLVACASGEQQIESHNEPLDLVPAFIYAGAAAVIAPLWPIKDEDGAEFSKSFYATLLGSLPSPGQKYCNVARAVQQSICSLKSKGDRSESLYHCAAYALQGSPFCLGARRINEQASLDLQNHLTKSNTRSTEMENTSAEHSFSDTTDDHTSKSTVHTRDHFLFDDEHFDFIVTSEFGDIRGRRRCDQREAGPVLENMHPRRV